MLSAPRLAAALALVLLLTGCSLRWDSGPPPVPEPSPAEQARQAAAEEAAVLVELAAAPRVQGEAARLVAEVGEAAAIHLDALGGRWEPWPEATAPPLSTPAPSEESERPAPGTDDVDAHDVLEALAAAAETAREAALAQPDQLGLLLASVSLSRTFAAADLAAALGVEGLAVDEVWSPEPALPEAADGWQPVTLQAVDGARYAFEVVAARSSQQAREIAESRATELESLVTASGSREAAYDVGSVLAQAPADEPAHRYLAAHAELDLMTAFLGELGTTDGPEAPELLAAAAHAASQARAWDAELPALPGLSWP